MFKKIQIQNFQAHQNTIIDLTDNVNVISGPSDSGKSAIIRALKWLCFNRARGEYLSDFVDKSATVSVKVWLDSGQIIERFRNKNNNGYRIWDSEKSDKYEEFKAIRQDVPKEVRKLLQIDDVNFQEQILNPYFMLEDTPGQITKRFNKLGGLETMDLAITMANRLVLKKRKKLEVLRDELDSVNQDIERTEWVLKIKDEIEEVENLRNEIDSIVKIIQTAEILSSRLESIESKLYKLKGIDKIKKEIEVIDEINFKVNKFNSIIERIDYFISSLIKLTDKITQNKKFLKVKSNIEKLIETYKEINDLEVSIDRISGYIQKFNDVRGRLRTTKQELIGRRKEYENLLNVIGVCPLCNSVLTQKG